MMRLSAYIPWTAAGISERSKVSLKSDHISRHSKGHAERNRDILNNIQQLKSLTKHKTQLSVKYLINISTA